MSTRALPGDGYVTLASTGSANATVVGLITTKFSEITFSGYKAAGTANLGTVYVRFAGTTGWNPITPQLYFKYGPTWPGLHMDLALFEFYVDTANDGIYYQFLGGGLYAAP